MKCYLVDPKLIPPENTIVYLYAHTDVKDKLQKWNFTAYNPDEAGKYSPMPAATKDYYKEMFSKGSVPLSYHRIPHILYKGALDISDLRVVSV